MSDIGPEVPSVSAEMPQSFRAIVEAIEDDVLIRLPDDLGIGVGEAVQAVLRRDGAIVLTKIEGTGAK